MERKHDKHKFVAPEVLARRDAEKQWLTCYCCGTEYIRGQFRCCAPPPGITSQKWLERHCARCSDDPTGLRTKCPKHCTCPTFPLVGVDSFTPFKDTRLKAQLEAKWNFRIDEP